MVDHDTNAAAHAWLTDFHAIGDSLDPKASVAKFYTEDCVMQFPGLPQLKGHTEILNFFERQFLLLESMKHTITHFDVLPDRIYQEATISYVVKGDSEKKPVEVQGIAMFGKGVNEDKMSFFTVYLNPAPLQERIQWVESQNQAQGRDD